MLIVTPLSPAAAGYYFRGREPGRWVGRGSGGLGVAGEVGRRDLVAVLRGCHPGDGRFLPARKPARRRAGWDLTLAAPKSLSLLGALAGRDGRDIAAAHRGAVDLVVADFERRLLTLRRAGAPGQRAAAAGLVGAAFDHGINAAGEPHLHTHLLVGNLGCDAAGAWSAIDPRWWTARQSLGSVYQLALRQQLRARGLALEWRLRDDGLADVAGVPRAAVRSASGRSRAATAERAGFQGGDGRMWGTRAGATVQTRGAAARHPWRERATAAGLGPDEAGVLLRDARARGRALGDEAGGRDLVGAVTARLAAQRSSFRASDVLVALAACHPDGMGGRQLEQWVDRFCAGSIPARVGPAAAARWTSAFAHAADRRLVELGRRWRPDGADGAAGLPADVVDAVLARYPGLSGTGRGAVRELLSKPGLVVLSAPAGRTNLLAQAAVLEAAGAAWQAAGLNVAVATATDQGAIRWRALTGLDGGTGGAWPRDRSARRGADLVVVDHADRRGTADLLAVLGDIHATGAAAVLVEGGTAPRLGWRRSDGLAVLGDQWGRLDAGPVPVWARDPLPAGDVGRAVGPVGPDVAACPDSYLAAGRLLARWAGEWTAGTPTTLVGLGYAEADGLNQAARAALVARGLIAGPALDCGGRILQAGDRVFALRRIAPDVERGAALAVVDVDPARSRISVAGRSGDRAAVTLDRRAAAHLGYAYAMTPALAARTAGPLLVLGPPDALGPDRSRVVAANWVAPDHSAGLHRALDRNAALDRESWRPLGRADSERDHGIGLG